MSDLSEWLSVQAESPFLDEGKLTPKAQAMTKSEFLDAYVKDKILVILDLVRAKDISCLVELENGEVTITNGHVHSDDYPFLAAAALFAAEPDKDFDSNDLVTITKLVNMGLEIFQHRGIKVSFDVKPEAS